MIVEFTEEEANAIQKYVTIGLFTSKDRDHSYMISVLESASAKIAAAFEPRQDTIISSNDLALIVSTAMGDYKTLHGDLHISNKKVEQKSFVHISLVNAAISWLNSKNLLKGLARFDYTDCSNEFDSLEE